MRFLRQSLTGLFMLSLTLGLLVGAVQIIYDAVQTRMNAEPRVPPARERVFAVNVVSATLEDVIPELIAFGEVQSRRTLEIRASSGGTIVELAEGFEDGAQVVAGQVLARIDPADARDALLRAQVDLRDAEVEAREADIGLALANDELRSAEVQVVLRRQAVQRQLDLSERGVGTAAAIEVADLALSAAESTVITRRQSVATAETRINDAAIRIELAEITLAEAERRLADTEISARFSGTLSDVTVVEGGLVSPNERLAQLIDPETLEVQFRVPVEAYARLLTETGDLRRAPVRVSLESMGASLQAQGVLVRDSAAVGEDQTGRLLFARLDAPRGFKPGDFVTVIVQEPVLPAVARLPASAVNAAGEVLVLGEDDRLEALPISVLRRQGNDVLVRSEALAGREVVAERTPLLGAGIKVRAVRPGQTSAQQAQAPATIQLSADRRAALRAFVEASSHMPDAVKARLRAQLEQPDVPVQTVERLEARMGG